jgi:hypothetical protein
MQPSMLPVIESETPTGDAAMAPKRMDSRQALSSTIVYF